MRLAPNTLHFFGIILFLFSTLSVSAKEPIDQKVNDGDRVNTNSEIDAYKNHHIKDAHDFHLYSYTNDAGERKHVGFPLPVIIWSSNGLVSFMSS